MTSFDTGADLNTTVFAHHRRQRFRSRFKCILMFCSLAFLLVTGCNSTTLFQSSFNSNPVGAPPSHNQSVGTIDVSGAPGSVVIVSSPPNAGSDHWAQIQRGTGAEVPITTMQCTFSQLFQAGSYTLTVYLFIPAGSGLATVEFDTSPQAGPPSTGFLHLDFMQNNTVRINDDSNQVFGTFPRDQVFGLNVDLEIASSSATAHIGLFGAGASGTKDLSNITPLSFAHQFGAVKFWMGFPWTGSFDVTNIVVTRKNQ